MNSVRLCGGQAKELAAGAIQHETKRAGELERCTSTVVHLAGVVSVGGDATQDVLFLQTTNWLANGQTSLCLVTLQVGEGYVRAILPQAAVGFRHQVVPTERPRDCLRMLRQQARPFFHVLRE